MHLLKNLKARLRGENKLAFIWTKRKIRQTYIIDKYFMLLKRRIRKKFELFKKVYRVHFLGHENWL